MENGKHHIVPYRTYVFILIVLLLCTFISIAVTNIELGELTVTAALVLASIKSFLVLAYFMHLKFDKPYIRIMVGFVFMVFLAVIVITFFDYLFR
jgi:cytochrome c oxidase subunit 4